MSQFILADEINRTSPKTQSCLLEVMEENQVTVDGKTYAVPKPFMVLATQNPVEYLGTYPLPEAQMDRFFMKITLGYPTYSEESKMLERFKASNPIENLEPVSNAEEVIEIQNFVDNVFVDKKIYDYIVSIVKSTREHPAALLGASPRGSLCLSKAARAWAFYNGRDFVIPDDVIKMSFYVLEHRIIMKQDAKFKKIFAKDVIEQAIESVRVL